MAVIIGPPARTHALARHAPEERRRHVTPRKRLRVVDTVIGQLVWPRDANEDMERPVRRSECRGGIRPCPYVRCKNHLGIELSPAGAIIHLWPNQEIWELEQSCMLDVIESHPHGLSLQQIADLFGISRERVRQILEGAVAKVKAAAPDLADDERNPGAGENCEGAAIDWGDE